LRKFAIRNDQQFKGQKIFAEFLVHYFTELDIPQDEQYDFWSIEHYLPELMVDAFEQLRTSNEPKAIACREAYVAELGREVPNLVDLGASDIVQRCLAVQSTVGFLLKDVLKSDWIEASIDSYCNAQQHVLQQTFDKFTRLVYRRGMFKLIDACQFKGMGGQVGTVELRTYAIAGRIMFTFAKRIDPTKKSYYEQGDNLICNEWSVSFVGEDNDPLLLSAGIQSVGADFRTSLDLIEEVIKNWPEDPQAQKKIFKVDKKISMF